MGDVIINQPTTRTLPIAGALAPKERVGAPQRILAIDALRGIALVAMALDHAASFSGVSLQAETYGGQAAVLESPAHWLSGLVTNLAAPTFWLFSGLSIALLAAARRKAGKSEWDITRFLFIRALVIIVLDLTWCQLVWAGALPYTHILLSIGMGLAILSVARLLPLSLLGGVGVAMLVGYQVWLPQIIVDYAQTVDFWGALFFGYSTKTNPAVEYALLGWPVLMLFGYLIGSQIKFPLMRRSSFWFSVGVGLLAVWFALRTVGKFGDLVPFRANDPWYFFLIMSKQPVSLTYLTFNLGIVFLLLALFYERDAWLERVPWQWIVWVGQVSFFFFVAHIGVYRLVSQLLTRERVPVPGLVRAYLVWLIGLLILFPLASVYRRVRRKHPESLLRYF